MPKEHKKNEAAEPKEEKIDQPTQRYFFPGYGVSIEAASIEEAEQKVKKMFNQE